MSKCLVRHLKLVLRLRYHRQNPLHGRHTRAGGNHKVLREGNVLNKCKINGDAPANSFSLSRPWRPYAKVVYLNCELPDFIRPEGWNNWGKESNEKTAYYSEYKSTGKSADPKNRANWPHQSTDNEYKGYILENVFHGWDPALK